MPDLRLARPLWRGRENVDALTIACIEHAEQLAGHEFIVTKGSYQPPDVETNSGHTHDGGGVADLRDCTHPVCLLHLRRAGLAAWRRTPAQGFDPHFHVVVVGHPLLHPEAEDQVKQYLTNTGNGLRGSTRDDGPRLDPIPRPVWPWPQEDDMPLSTEDIDKIATAVVEKQIADDGRTVAKALRQASKAAGLEDAIVKRVQAALLSEPGDVAVTVTAEQIEDAVKAALREGTGD